jgi:hypothetical protein
MLTLPTVLIMASLSLGMLYSLDMVVSLGHPRSKVQLLIPQGLLSTLLVMLRARKSFGSVNSLTNLVSISLLNLQLFTLTAILLFLTSIQWQSTLRTSTSRFHIIGLVNKSSLDTSRLIGYQVRKILLMFS